VITRICVIDVGTGNPELLTVEAVHALRSVDVFLVGHDERSDEVGDQQRDLDASRRALFGAVIPADRSYRVLELAHPLTVSGIETGVAAYGIGEETTVGLLAWAGADLLDDTIRLARALMERSAAGGSDVELDVVPGLSTAQVLAARHRVSLQRNGVPLHVTTGRRLVDEFDLGLGDVVVIGDEDLACTALVDAFPDLELCWGAYLGSEDELLLHGRLEDVIEQVQQVRASARQRHGWIVDTYLLRRPGDAPVPAHAGPSYAPFPDVATWEPLTDGVVTVRPLEATDWPVLLEESNNAESLRWSFDGRPLTEVEARHKTAEAPREWRRGRVARFVIVDAASGQGAGVLMVLRMGPPGIGVVGYGIVPGFRGRGFTSRALTLVCGWVFDHTDIQRLELGHKVGNVASGKAAERAGFVAEGRLAGRLPNADGTRADEVSYALLRPGH
jgi:precorrin-6A synthase (deacetylating)